MMVFIFNLVAALLLAALMVGFVNKTKAKFAGRRGASVFQLYYDLAKLLAKGSPRSLSSTWIFDLAPIVSLVAIISGGALILVSDALSSRHLIPVALFAGFYLLGTARFWTVLAARDVASAFPDMGSAREVQFSAFVEAILFAVLGFLAVERSEVSVQVVLVAVAAFVMLLSENCRVPFDDPETHLELTMIHEAMILDNSGPDLAFILYGAALKLWIFAAFFLMVILPEGAVWGALIVPGALVVGVLVGAVESSMARMRFTKTPFVLSSAFALAVLALVLEVLH